MRWLLPFFPFLASCILIASPTKDKNPINQETLNEIRKLAPLLGKDTATMYEAILYENGSEEIKDLDQAIKRYYQLYLDGNPLGAIKIGLFCWEIENESMERQEAIKKKYENVFVDGFDPVNYFTKGRSYSNELKK